MLRSILVGLDGSPYSEAAVELSIRWARQLGARLAGIGIVDEPTIRAPIGLVTGGGSRIKPLLDEERMADAHRQVHEFLDKFADRCRDEGVTATQIKEVGLPSEEILEEAQQHDLILLGQQTYFHFETQEGPGETLHTIVESAPRPVVTVPAELPSGEAVLIACDDSLQASRALQAFAVTGLAGPEPVHVVCADEDQGRAEQVAERAAGFLERHEIAVTRHAIATEEDAADVLLRKAAEVDAGLIVMGAYGRRTIVDFFFGSLTCRMLKEAQIPLFVYH